jgi:RNA polymerase sigma-70 factor (ECF subfamily)
MKPAAHALAAPPLTDAEMASRVAAGDEAAFRLLMKRHNQAMFRASRSILRDDAEAEDAVQEAYLQAYRRIADFRGDSKLSTWLLSIAVNEAIGRLRRRQRRATVISLEGDIAHGGDAPADERAADESGGPESLAVRAEARRLLERTIDGLPEAFRSVFVLRAVQELDVDDTAAALGIPEATVRTRFFRARALLRESLSREFDLAHEDAFEFLGERCDRIVARVIARLSEAPPGGT